MVRILLLAGMMLMLGLFLLDEHLGSEANRSWQAKSPRQIRLAADPSLKRASEDSPYMRSER